ncbi:DUF4873 domain-containing protein [Crossiella cryophila]|uniref:DUF4873 domain-containing protein n=1 Tax=Crossiella cryophila TaxID=43355 RepID=A0A7W7FQ91_9PSEU|nr:DUF4873 domain-containing protein [Crossiella cryophila]MBB4673942.1 hypothetical protein [Crossiella cryophila]
MSEHEHDEEGYQGSATLLVAGRELPVEVRLRGHFEPIDGRYHWYGRIAAHTELTDLVQRSRPEATLRTPVGEAAGEVSDQDPWGRYRITGLGRPPFEVDDVNTVPPAE